MEKYTHRYIAKIILEAETPLFVGSGETSLLKDALVQKDIHGFPMIQGTSLAGVLRHAFLDKYDEDKKDKDKSKEQKDWESFFGYQAPTGKEGRGSQVKVSSAYLILNDGKIAEGINISEEQKNFLKYFEDLPSRQHVRITHRGVADTEKNALFDNEVVYKGCRFIFEIELKGNKEDETLWNEFLNQLKNPLFRIGQGTRNGYGKLAVHSCKTKIFDLENEQDFRLYLNYNISFNINNAVLKEFKEKLEYPDNLLHYKLRLKPENFFMFGAGYGDNEVDNIPIEEEVIFYDKNNSIQKPKKQTLIPASSIKGALSHRTAFHYNKLKGIKADEINKENFNAIAKIYTGTNNLAVFELFGAEEGAEKTNPIAQHSVEKDPKGQRGKIIMNDLFLKDAKKDKIFNHVAIDRFTGGAMDGALFSEKVSYFDDKNKEIELDIFIEDADNIDETIIKSFEDALKDVCKGLLPLGGMTTKGHGIFTGKFFINNNEKPEFDYENK